MSKGFSLVPSTFKETGYGPNGVDGTIKSLKATNTFRYPGKEDDIVAALAEFEYLVDGEVRTHKQTYTVGGGVRANEEGTGFDGPINKSSNFAFFLMELISSGLPEVELAEGDLSKIEGCRIHIEQRTNPKGGTSAKPVPIATKYLGKGDGTNSSTLIKDLTDADDDTIAAALGMALATSKVVARNQINKIIFEAFKEMDQAAKFTRVTRGLNEGFLKKYDGKQWKYDGKSIAAL